METCSGCSAIVRSSVACQSEIDWSGQPEHQIDVQVVEPRLAQNVKRFRRLRSVVFASEYFKQSIVPRLHAKTDAIDAAITERFCLARGNTSWVCFHGPFLKFGKIEPVHQNRRTRNSSCADVNAVGVPPPKKMVCGWRGNCACA